MTIQDKNKYNSPKYRLVVRITNKDIIAQVVQPKIVGDHTLAAAYSPELLRYGGEVRAAPPPHPHAHATSPFRQADFPPHPHSPARPLAGRPHQLRRVLLHRPALRAPPAQQAQA